MIKVPSNTINSKILGFILKVWITKIDTVPVIENLSGFEFIVDSVYNYNLFCYSDGSCSYYGEYNYSNQEYSLYYKIVLQSSGLYRLSQGSAIYPLGEWQDFEGKCWNVYSDVSTKLNDGIDNNVAFLNNSPDPHYNDWILQEPDYRFHRGGLLLLCKGITATDNAQPNKAFALRKCRHWRRLSELSMLNQQSSETLRSE